MEYAKEKTKLCADCAHGRQRFRDCCYCVKYGIIIGYGKKECRGYEREQVQESEDGIGRDHVRQPEGSKSLG